ncbi:MAG TPA: glycosyltransferase family 4 protein [Patescibacteria group bacterium]|nr:glycosyltransferase family 4 protein [Patescibacteria group bacterium]
MKIVQIAPLWENIPPPLYGGTERIVSSITEGLVTKGHDVTLFAVGTSHTNAKLVSVYPRPLFRDHIAWTNIMYPLLNITEAFDREKEFDIIHMHLNKSSDYLALSLAVPIKHKVVFTLHFPYPVAQNRDDRHAVFQKYKDLNYISISNSQRRGGENMNWIATVYNGIDLTPFTLNHSPQNYLLWLGKFNPDKGTREAIQAAQKAGMTIKIAGAIDKLEGANFEYWEKEVKPLIDNHRVIFVGEVDDVKKNKLYGNAYAFLNPIQWNEPFGLVMVEAMATGTPVISFKNGAAPELIKNNETGYLVDTVDEMVEAIGKIDAIDRKTCRLHVEKHFTEAIMTNNYEDVYQKILDNMI